MILPILLNPNPLQIAKDKPPWCEDEISSPQCPVKPCTLPSLEHSHVAAAVQNPVQSPRRIWSLQVAHLDTAARFYWMHVITCLVFSARGNGNTCSFGPDAAPFLADFATSPVHNKHQFHSRSLPRPGFRPSPFLLR